MLSPGDPLLFYGGAALCLVVVGQALLGGIGFFRARQQQRDRSDADAAAFAKEVAAAAESARARLARSMAWEGRRRLRVSAVVDEAPDVKSLFLTDPEGRPLPRFLPGQYLTLALPAGAGGTDVVRCYSLSDRPRDEYYRLTVRRQDAPDETPDAPPGVGSNWLHRHAATGLEIACEAPRGAFFYNPGQPRPAVLIGAGVGVTPLVSMLATIHQERITTPTHLFFGFRNGTEHLLADEVREIVREDAAISAHYSYSQPTSEDQLGTHYHSRGRITLETLRRVLPSNNFEFFVCGPPRMMQSLVPDLLDWGVPEEAIHFEAFGPASVRTNRDTGLVDRAIGSPVRFLPSDEPIVWDGGHGSLLELAEAAGVPVASGCRAGNCGACRVRVLEGKVAPLRRPGLVTPNDECLACISLPDGPVLLKP
ncbi:MAG: 2Fe-2S iron-sulfur cluster-binding protein [Planctomycetota bacterium]